MYSGTQKNLNFFQKYPSKVSQKAKEQVRKIRTFVSQVDLNIVKKRKCTHAQKRINFDLKKEFSFDLGASSKPFILL